MSAFGHVRPPDGWRLFSSGLHTAALVTGVLCLLGAVVAVIGIRRGER